MKHYTAMTENLNRTYHEHAHAKAVVERLVGDRLRAHQQVAISVIEKCNGRTIKAFPRRDFHTASGTWAVAMAEGFVVEALHPTHVTLRSLALPTTTQRAVTHKLDLDWLTLSDRDVAKRLRTEIRTFKASDHQYAMKEARRTSQALARTIRQQEAKLARLRAEESALAKSLAREEKRKLAVAIP